MLPCRPLTIITCSLLSPEKEEAAAAADEADVGEYDYDNYYEDNRRKGIFEIHDHHLVNLYFPDPKVGR